MKSLILACILVNLVNLLSCDLALLTVMVLFFWFCMKTAWDVTHSK